MGSEEVLREYLGKELERFFKTRFKAAGMTLTSPDRLGTEHFVKTPRRTNRSHVK